MRTYWDHTEIERAKLTDDEVRGLLKFELMEQGIVSPQPPELLDDTEPKVAKKAYFAIEALGRYGSHSQLDVCFETIEQAKDFMGMKPLEKRDGYPDYYNHAVPYNDMRIVQVELAGEQDYFDAKEVLQRVKANRDQNKKAREEFEKAVNAANDATEAIWDDWRKHYQKLHRLNKVVSLWEDYLSTCDNEEGTALKFLAKVHGRGEIQEANEWCEANIPLPVAVEVSMEASV